MAAMLWVGEGWKAMPEGGGRKQTEGKTDTEEEKGEEIEEKRHSRCEKEGVTRVS